MKRCAALMLLGGLLLSIGPATSAAEVVEDGYPSYRDQVEPICKSMSERASTPVDSAALTKGYAPERAAVRLRRAGRALLWGKRVAAAIEAPPAEREQIDEWVDFVGDTSSRYLKSATAAAHGHEMAARHQLRGLRVPQRVARIEDALKFSYCKIEPRRWVVPIRWGAGG
jgi:hypothetical protein